MDQLFEIGDLLERYDLADFLYGQWLQKSNKIKITGYQEFKENIAVETSSTTIKKRVHNEPSFLLHFFQLLV